MTDVLGVHFDPMTHESTPPEGPETSEADRWLARCMAQADAPDSTWEQALEHLMAAERWNDAKDVVVVLDGRLRAQGRHDARIELLQRVQAQPWPDVVRGLVLRQGCRALTDMERTAEAEAMADEAVAVLERACQTDDPVSRRTALRTLAEVCQDLGRLERAVAALRRSIELDEQAHGSRRTEETIPTLITLAQLLVMQERADEALEIATDAWEGSVEVRLLSLAVQAGPVYAFVLAELGQNDEAQHIGGAVVHLLRKLPADHPVRLKVEQQIRLRE